MASQTKKTDPKAVNDFRRIYMSPDRCAICGFLFEQGDEFTYMSPLSMELKNPPDCFDVKAPCRLHMDCLVASKLQ